MALGMRNQGTRKKVYHYNDLTINQKEAIQKRFKMNDNQLKGKSIISMVKVINDYENNTVHNKEMDCYIK